MGLPDTKSEFGRFAAMRSLSARGQVRSVSEPMERTAEGSALNMLRKKPAEGGMAGCGPVALSPQWKSHLHVDKLACRHMPHRVNRRARRHVRASDEEVAGMEPATGGVVS